MKNRNQWIRALSILGLGLISARGLDAACPPAALQVRVPPGATAAYLPKSALGIFGGVVQSTAPIHGTVTDLGDRLAYTPNRSFWNLGVDSIVVSPTGRNELPKSVWWIAATRWGQVSSENFEDPANPNWDLGSFDPAAISTFGKLSGNFGLRFTSSSTGAGSTSATLPVPDTNGATAGGGAVGGWRPPGGGGPSGWSCGEGVVCPTGVWYPFLEADGDNDGQVDSAVFIKELGNEVQVGLSPGDTLPPGADPIVVKSVTRQAHFLELIHWWGEAGRSAGAALWVDGIQELAIETAQQSASLVEPTANSKHTFNEVPATWVSGAPDLYHSFDNLAVFDLAEGTRFDCVALDGFDSGVFDPAWTLYNGANLSAETSAALAGKLGLDVEVTDLGASSGGQLQLPGVTSRDRHGLRFRFDPNTVEMESGATLNLALAFQSATVPRPFLVLLKRNAGGLTLQILSRDDNGAAKSTTVAISDAPHVLEVDWQRSKTVHVPTGYLRVWLDGVLEVQHLGLDNDAQSITELRVGALGALGAAKGHVYLDQIETWSEASMGR